MFFSKKYNLLYIASPKSGTVSIHEALAKLDPNGERRLIQTPNKVITGEDLKQGIIGHARAREIKEAVGDENFEHIETIAFVRNPYAKLVSSYFFNRNNNLSNAFKIKGKKNNLKRKVNYFITTLFAKIMPFNIWALVYPYRSNSSYITDKNGTLIVKYLGRTEYLNDDFHKIMKQLDIKSDHIQVGRKNTSIHQSFDKYYKANWFKKKMYKKMKRDIDLYNKVCEKLN